ncbi:MAG: ABC transporter ATP-binding protein [Chloroflexota bacterium]|nr:MAG: ABC transporter ATP-binding protein [Chloroflexota bacterium]
MIASAKAKWNDLHLFYSHRRYTAPVPESAALEIENLCVNRPNENVLALENISVRVPIGTRLALVGPNGAGKSTLLKTIAGLLPIRSGKLLIYGLPVGACHHRVAYLPQRGEIDWRFPITLRRLVMTGRYVHLGWLRRPSPRDWQIVDQIIARLGLSELAERQIGQLSGGQQQRALLARALAQEADLILLDEPTSAVDAETQAIISRLIAELSRDGKTLVVATHNLERLESDFDSVLYLREGRQVSESALQHTR